VYIQSSFQLDFSLSAGGVVLIGANNRITIDNTLDERLRLLEDRVRGTISGD
jgi:vacuolar-type H+-ATPase subunit E/Vma4